jgi:ribonuclease-3
MAAKRLTEHELAEAIGQRTGYAFRNAALLRRALTHASKRGSDGTDNERLEFLGDRVLGLVVSEMLFNRYPEARQGELAVRLNALVSGETCGVIAMELGLDRLIHADPVARSAKGNALADAVEALIAAIYLDGGLEPARAFIAQHWEHRAETVAKILRSAKTELQEWLAQRDGLRPNYSIVSREGPDHEPLFTVSVEAKGFVAINGVGPSRQSAEQAAAAAFLVREGVWDEEGMPS